MTRHLLKKTLLAASALTVLAAAPAAFAAPTIDTKASVTKQSTNYIKTADRGDRGDRSRSQRGDRNRSNRHRGDRHRSNRHHSDRHRSNRHRSHHNRGYRNYDRGYRHRDNYRRTNRHYNRHYSSRHRGHYTPYRSNLGISFHFGTPGYSRYRWAQTAHSYYRPSYGSYGYYQSNTVCRRINVEGWHHGHRELVSVKECSNPWDGTYIVQGSERVINCRW